MASNDLTVKLGLDSSQFESQLNKVISKLDAINYATQRMNQSLGEGDKAGQRLARNAERLKKAEYEQWWQSQLVNRELQKTNPILTTLYMKSDGIGNKFKGWKSTLENFNKSLEGSNNLASGLNGKINRLVNTYLGIMGTKALINTSDTITGAENKLNNINAKSLGASGYDVDGSYSQATLTATQETMDKMYASAQKVRMGYGDMMNNVSKSMTLASGAFKGNIDNAIRFQEVMAEAYAIGGASAEEMSSSMYQMIQALGAGTLAGDELRSVREGAPLAYQAIEEFVQGVYGTEESLKDLASQGKVTSDMVVAAIMHASDEIDASFAQTAQRFSETWTQIKNAATKAFEPVSRMMREALNKAVDNGMIQKIEDMFTTAAEALQVLFNLTEKVVTWIVDNWDWIKNVIVAGLALLVSYYATMTAIAVTLAAVRLACWLMEYWYIALIIVAIAAVIYCFYLWQQGALSTSDLMVAVCLIIVSALIVVSLATGSVVLLMIAGILLVLATAFYFFEEICGGINGVVSWIAAACQNIGIFFANLWHGATASFWNFIGNVLSGIKDLEPAFNAIAKLFGLEGVTLSGLAASAYSKADAASGKIKSYHDLGDAWSTGYQEGYDWAAGIKDKINKWGSDKRDEFSLDEIKEKLGLDLGQEASQNNMGNMLNTTPVEDLLGDMNDKLGGVKGDTGSIKDSMELTEEDLKEFRKLANRDWINKHTTAHVAVHMNNKNTINNKGDLDNWVISLRDMLTEEIDAVANGVYA